MVLENPKKSSHEIQYQEEIGRRLEKYCRIKDIVCNKGSGIGMKKMGFTEKRLYKQYQVAFYLACAAHKGQYDKGGLDYICHPVVVATYIQENMEPSKKRDRAMVAAMLHDTLEDTLITKNALKCFGFSKRIIRTVVLLSRDKGEDYGAYLDRLMVSRLAMIVKCADMADNENLNRLEHPSQRDINRCEFYRSGRLRLERQLRNNTIFL
ncbi:MAG TPA: hypothetical protein DF613_07380 [Lachnospiraceae bacterium]|nr:hypothetical protein [Lachnospiraceae bacterium]